MKELRRDKERRLAWLKERQRRSREEEEEQRKAELKRRRNPQRKEDFSLLYSYLESETACLSVLLCLSGSSLSVWVRRCRRRWRRWRWRRCRLRVGG